MSHRARTAHWHRTLPAALTSAVLVLAPLTVAAQTAADAISTQPLPPDTSLPAPEELEADGAVIGEIRITVGDIFDTSIPGERAWLYRTANKLHIETREETIRDQLLFKPGEPYRARVIDETVTHRHLHELGAGPDEAHVTAQHVEQLWELVEAPLADEAAHLRVPGIGLRLVGEPAILPVPLVLGAGPTVVAHGAELDHAERPAAAADALLEEQHLRTHGETHGQRDRGDQRREHDEQNARGHDVEEALEEPVVRTDLAHEGAHVRAFVDPLVVAIRIEREDIGRTGGRGRVRAGETARPCRRSAVPCHCHACCPIFR